MAVSVRIDSRHLPPLTFGGEGGEASSGDGFGAWLVRVMQPRIRASVGSWPVLDFAPKGNPEGSTWPLLGIALVVVVGGVVGLALYGLVSAIRR